MSLDLSTFKPVLTIPQAREGITVATKSYTIGALTAKRYEHEDGKLYFKFLYNDELKALYLQSVDTENEQDDGVYVVAPQKKSSSFSAVKPLAIRRLNLQNGLYLPHPDNPEVFVVDTAVAPAIGTSAEKELLWLQTSEIEPGDYVAWSFKPRDTSRTAIMSDKQRKLAANLASTIIVFGQLVQIKVERFKTGGDKEETPLAYVKVISPIYKEITGKTHVILKFNSLTLIRKGEK